jgi:hypothetical protein
MKALKEFSAKCRGIQDPNQNHACGSRSSGMAGGHDSISFLARCWWIAERPEKP